MPEPTHCYIARRKKCGCITAFVVDNGQVAEEVAMFLKSKRTIEYVTIEDARKEHFGCVHRAKQERLEVVP